jgi:hypothetical protein
MPYRILCNGVQREGAKLSLALASELFCPLPLHQIRYGVDPLGMNAEEEIYVQTFTLDEALAATTMDYCCDPEAALALWLYAGHSSHWT